MKDTKAERIEREAKQKKQRKGGEVKKEVEGNSVIRLIIACSTHPLAWWTNRTSNPWISTLSLNKTHRPQLFCNTCEGLLLTIFIPKSNL